MIIGGGFCGTLVAKKLENYDCIIFFKGGARKAYLHCIKNAAQKAGKPLVTLGYANMGGINDWTAKGYPVVINE